MGALILCIVAYRTHWNVPYDARIGRWVYNGFLDSDLKMVGPCFGKYYEGETMKKHCSCAALNSQLMYRRGRQGHDWDVD